MYFSFMPEIIMKRPIWQFFINNFGFWYFPHKIETNYPTNIPKKYYTYQNRSYNIIICDTYKQSWATIKIFTFKYLPYIQFLWEYVGLLYRVKLTLCYHSSVWLLIFYKSTNLIACKQSWQIVYIIFNWSQE